MALINGEKILNILGSNSRVIYIPIYQRNYDWKEAEASKLINDIWEFRKIVEQDDESLYFAGSMIYKKIVDDNSAQDKISLVDGQQRITTFLLILRALGDFPEIDTDPYLFSNSKDNKTLKISRSKSESTLEKILSGAHDDLNEEEKNGNYWLNYLSIKDEIIKQSMSPIKIFNLLRDSVAVAWVQLKKSEDENVVFETINSTGIALTASDLIKNFTLSKIHTFNEKESKILEKIYNNRLEDIFSNKNFKNDEFFRYFTAIKGSGELVSKKDSKNIYFSFKRMINDSEFNVSDFKSVKELLLVMLKAALIYQRAIDKKISDVHSYEDSKMNLFKLILRDNMSYFPIYFELVNNWTKLEENQITFINLKATEYKILESISKYYFYRRISGRKDKNITRDVVLYFKKYKKVTNEISISGFEEFLSKRESHDQQLPDLDSVIRNIKNLTYNKDRTLLKHVLMAVEIENDREDTAPFNLLKHKLELEHILPQESNLWREDFRKDNRLEEFHKFDDDKDYIQNIALLTEKRNREIKNSIYKNKIESIKKDKRIQMNQVFNKYAKYNRELLNERMLNIITNFAMFYNSKILNAEDYIKTGAEIKQVLRVQKNNSNFYLEDTNMQDRIHGIEKEILNGKYENIHSGLRTCLEKLLDEDYKGSLFEKISIIENTINDEELVDSLHFIRRKGNKETHSFDKSSTKTTAIFALENFHKIVSWRNNEVSSFDPDVYTPVSDDYNYQIDNSTEITLPQTRTYNQDKTKKIIDHDKEIIEKNKLAKLNVSGSLFDRSLRIFDYVPYREISTKGYNKKAIEGFGRELAEEALLLYLHDSKGNKAIDCILLPNMRRENGYVTAATLAYYNIETGGPARGSLKNQESARELIRELIDSID